MAAERFEAGKPKLYRSGDGQPRRATSHQARSSGPDNPLSTTVVRPCYPARVSEGRQARGGALPTWLQWPARVH
jgi:hypothetical protein